MAQNDFIAVDPIDLARVIKLLKTFPPEIANALGDELAPYLVSIMQAYPKYKYVSRKKAYGRSFFSVKQRKWFFAALARGEINIPYKRTQKLREGWKILGSGMNTLVVNETPYATFTQGDERTQQSRHEKLVGWRSTDNVIKAHSAAVTKKIEAAIKKALRSR